MKLSAPKTFLSKFAVIVAISVFIVSSAWAAQAPATAVVALAAMDYSSGAHQLIDIDPVGGPRVSGDPMAFAGSDLSLVADGDYFYKLSRSQANHITKYKITQPDTVIWQYSVEGSDTGSNPHDMVIVSETKAYVVRYGSTKAWIVNPSATSSDDFKIGEIDLSAYADNDGLPEMHSAALAGDKLFITMQRIDFSGGWGNYVYNTPYIAVIDTNTDTEIETGKGEAGLNGVPLPFENPNMIQFLSDNNTIYVQGVGQWGAAYTSGIASLNPDSFDTTLIWDDGTPDNHPYGTASGMMIVSPTKGYIITYAGWGDNTLYRFNPSDNEDALIPVSDDLTHVNIAAMESGARLDPNGMYWIGLTRSTDGGASTSAEIAVLNTENDTIDETISLSMQPLKIIFCGKGTVDSGGSSSSSSCFINASAAPGETLWGISVLMIAVAGLLLLRRNKKTINK